jgi:hypothetical protein
MDGIRAAARALTSPQAPPVWDAIEQRTRSGDNVVFPAIPARAAGRPRRFGLATLILLIAAVAASATMLVQPLRTRLNTTRAEPAPAPVAGIEIPLSAATLDIVLRGPSPEVRLAITISTSAAAVRVTGLQQAAASRFTLGEKRLTVADLHGGELHIEVPAASGEVVVSSDGVVVARVRAGRIVQPPAASTGRLDATLRALMPPRGNAP